jgi:hypothetical protein
MGTRYRMRSVENVLAEMTEKIEQGFRSFDFEDDHLGGDRKWFLALLKGINIRFAGLDLSLQAMNGITAANLDSEILSAMWTAGFRSLNLALVTRLNPGRKISGDRLDGYLPKNCRVSSGFRILHYILSDYWFTRRSGDGLIKVNSVFSALTDLNRASAVLSYTGDEYFPVFGKPETGAGLSTLFSFLVLSRR